MTPLASRIDELMLAPKRVAGIPTWRRSAYEGTQRWLAPLEIGGEVTRLQLAVDSRPSAPSLDFTILVLYGSAVQRLDYAAWVMHRNHEVRGVVTPTGLRLGWIKGPHCHDWTDNRILVGAELPKELEFARELPPNVQGFDNAFRWFCGEVNVHCPSDLPPELPRRETLL